jgi:hypothetical protein
MLRSRLTVSLIAIGSGGFAFLLHPELSARLALGFSEFLKASREVTSQLQGDDDDNDPHAA